MWLKVPPTVDDKIDSGNISTRLLLILKKNSCFFIKTFCLVTAVLKLRVNMDRQLNNKI